MVFGQIWALLLPEGGLCPMCLLSRCYQPVVWLRPRHTYAKAPGILPALPNGAWTPHPELLHDLWQLLLYDSWQRRGSTCPASGKARQVQDVIHPCPAHLGQCHWPSSFNRHPCSGSARFSSGFPNRSQNCMGKHYSPHPISAANYNN